MTTFDDAWLERCKERIKGQDDLLESIRKAIQKKSSLSVKFIVLEGPDGLGKRYMLEQITKDMPHTTLDITDLIPGTEQARIIKERVFKAAVLLLPDLELLLPSRDYCHENAVIKNLVKAALNRRCFGDEALVVFASCKDVSLLDEDFIKEGYFIRTMQVSFSKWQQRLAILQMYCKGRVEEDWAMKTAGFTPRDLLKLLKQASIEEALRLKLIRPSLMIKGFDTNLEERRLDDLVGVEEVVRGCMKLLEMAMDVRTLGLGIRSSRGILLHGPSGCGKTHLGVALAQASKLNYHYLQASQLRSKYVGEAERKIQETFKMARQSSPCILILDHLDVVLPSRKNLDEIGSSGVRVLSTFLTEIDGIEAQRSSTDAPVILIAMATSLNSIDPALLRSGRIENHFALKHKLDRSDIQSYFSRKGLEGVEIDEAELTGAELDLLWREACLNRIKRGENEDFKVELEDLQQALTFMHRNRI